MPHIDLRPDLFGITSLLAFRPETAAPLCELTQVLLRGPSTLSEAERELIATYVSQRNECVFCATAHASATCHLPGGDAALVAAVRENLDTAPVSEKLRALLRIAGQVQESGRAVRAEDVALAKVHGATDVELHDTVLIAALFCLYNRYVDGLGTALPEAPGYFDALGARITTRGYSMPPNGYQPLLTGAKPA
jgi:uncharacterized peroxidase-related enzyme